MTSIRIQRVVRQVLCLVSVPFVAGGLLLAQQPAPTEQAPPQLLSPQQLDSLVAPVALYPDALLSQVLVSSTYPLEIGEAAMWLQQNGNLQGSQLVDAAHQQNWDPSIQALVVFPDVVNRLSVDVQWTTDLGNAFLAQQADVMHAVQRMRAQAMAAGKLRSNEQQTVTTEMQGDQSAIDIQPANPEVVYVPYYNPEYIWGPPAYGYYPRWDHADIGIGFGYRFGPGIYVGGFFGGLGWGGWGWGPNWFHCSIFENSAFFNDYGFARNGFAAGGIWAHNPGHRLGVPYSNGVLNQRYGALSTAGARSPFAGSRYNTASRTNAAQVGGWNHFSQGGQTATHSAPANGGYRASPSFGGNSGANRNLPSYRPGPSNGSLGVNRASPSYGGNSGGTRSVPSYRSSPAPSYGNSGAYRASPSYGGNSGGTRSVPSYRSSPAPSYGNSGAYRTSPSYGGNSGGTRSVPSYRAGPSYSGGASSRSSSSSPRSGGGGGSVHGSNGSDGGGTHR